MFALLIFGYKTQKISGCTIDSIKKQPLTKKWLSFLYQLWGNSIFLTKVGFGYNGFIQAFDQSLAFRNLISARDPSLIPSESILTMKATPIPVT
jgi:hypothetical protein